MRKSLLSLAVLSALSIPTAVFAEEAAAPAAAAPAPAYTISYNVGLYSQYVFRGLTQTSEKPSLQGGVDFTHASGFYLGTWASNISWLEDAATASAGGNTSGYRNSSLELDVYGGYRNTIGATGLGYDFSVLQYIYPGSNNLPAVSANTTELAAALSYKWLQGKFSYIASKNGLGNADARGTYYAELNANYPIGETGITVNAHVGRQKFDGGVADFNDITYSYTDWKIGATKSFANGVNVGGYYTDTNGSDAGYGSAIYAGGDIAKSTFTAFVQKTF
ncbi:Conserved hypothetical protein CHP02001 [Methylophilaceae bacterium]|jgi:uncharacterized protein (TIGR02001 family)